MTRIRDGSILATGNCLMLQMRKPVASIIKPPHAEKSASISGVCVFRLNPATIPAGKRPPFRWEKGQHSDSIAGTIPTKKASA